WKLVDEVVARQKWDETVAARAAELAGRSDRPAGSNGIVLTPLVKHRSENSISYPHLTALLDRPAGTVQITVTGPDAEAGTDVAAIHRQGADFWSLALARELDDLILDLRTNELELGCWIFRSTGDSQRVLGHDDLLLDNTGDWLANEIIHYLKRTLKRLDVTSRSLLTLVEPGSCFAGSLLELVLAADRSFQLAGVFSELDPAATPATLVAGTMNFGSLPMGNGLSRLATRFLDDDAAVAAVRTRIDAGLDAEAAAELGLITFAPDDLDWDDEIRMAVEERASFSPDALTGLEANYRFAGPETMETKIFGRLAAWQNWIFYRPNASGAEGALRRFGTGQRAEFDRRRV
ncbi:MAG: 2,3-epoxybenzoyl-CoA dihydrolase, partial [Jatrophihabitans sp.]